MKSILTCVVLLFLFSCKEKKQQVPIPAQTIPDSAIVQTIPHNVIYVERASLELKNYSVTIQSKFEVSATPMKDSSEYFEGHFLFVFNKTLHRTDTVEIQESAGYSPWDMGISDMTDSLHFKSLLLCLHWRGDSDMMVSYFAGYVNDTLKELFSVDDLVSIRRKDEKTLTGFTSGRDELVYNSQDDYPFTVSLKSYEVTYELPPVQYIGHLTTALSSIKGYRISKNNDSSAYLIKKGTRLMVDTIYRNRNQVTLIIADSIKVRTRIDQAEGKLLTNSAG